MSAHEVISLMLQFGLFLVAALSLVVTIMKHMSDSQNKKK
ncbi:putative holin-like toxin [Tumebacillus sp. BK434]|nr:putative holin-like toxin [Tumebacillus sp. BK434]TCP55986.1 putative holin-like toxin [Tumebacillus sp. BK434]